MSLSNVKPGDPFQASADAWNRIVNATKAQEAGATRAPGQVQRQKVWPCLNDSGSDIDIFTPIKITGPMVDPGDNENSFDTRVGFRVEPITTLVDLGSIAVAMAPIRAGKIGPGIALGICPTTVDVLDINHTHATPNASGVFESAESGPAEILWKDSGTGNQRAIIALVPSRVSESKRWARITGSTSLATRRWSYDWETVTFDGVDWNTLSPTVTSSTLGKAINTLEASNSATGIQGNGVDEDNLLGTFDLVPIGDGAVVEIRGPYNDSVSGDDFWLFTAANLVDGDCP